MLAANLVYCDDALSLLSAVDDESVDLVFADPPFNIGKAYQDARTDYRDWCAEWIAECFRVLKDTGSFYLMTLSRHLEWEMPLMAEHGVFVNLIAWRNVSAAHSKRQFWNEYQPILLYGKSMNYIFNTYAQTEDTGYRRWGGYSGEYRGQLKDHWTDIPFVYAGSVCHPEAVLQSGTNQKVHPVQMPIALARRAILFSTPENGIVLDPFAGSGTTALACMETERRYICIEIEEKFCQLAERRIKNHIWQPSLPM